MNFIVVQSVNQQPSFAAPVVGAEHAVDLDGQPDRVPVAGFEVDGGSRDVSMNQHYVDASKFRWDQFSLSFWEMKTSPGRVPHKMKPGSREYLAICRMCRLSIGEGM